MELVTGVETYLRSGLLPVYYIAVLLGAFIIWVKFEFKIVPLFIILLFCEGLVVYLSRNNVIFSYVYKVGFFVFAFIIFSYKLIRVKKTRHEKLFLVIFSIIGLVFLISFIINNSNFFTILSQYLKKYGIPLLFYFGLKAEYHKENNMNMYASLFTWLLGFQIILVFFKLYLFGFGESLVGSISFLGGGAGNIIPILGFFLFWIKRNDVLTKSDWLFVLTLFLSIAIIGNKRSILFVWPFVVASVYTFVSKSMKITTFVAYLPILLIVFVIGVKTNPTLNPTGSRWGKFDLNYVFDYAAHYTFGDEYYRASGNIGYGRGDGAYKIAAKLKTESLFIHYIFGYGVEEIFSQDYAGFETGKFGVRSKGALSSFAQNFVATGLLGAVLIFFFGVSLVRTLDNKQLRRIIYIFLAWDYFLFINSTIAINASSILLVFICLYYNWLKDQRVHYL